MTHPVRPALARRLCVAALAGLLAVAAAAGCGGGGDAKLPPPVTVAAAPATTAPATTGAARAAAPKKRRAKHHRAAAAKSTQAVVEARVAQEAQQVTPEIVANAKPRGSKAPVPCLRKAGLTKPAGRRGGGWQGRITGSTEQVFIDGPYRTDREARLSADSLSAVNDVAAAGGYVVSAALASHARPHVVAVARCLHG